MDHNGHGTHVAGTIAGVGTAKFQNKDGNLVPLKGVAPDAKIIICKVSVIMGLMLTALT